MGFWERISKIGAGHALDGLINTLTGMNTRRDKSSYNQYVPVKPLNQIDLESFYVGSWLARRIVDCVAEDMTREWLTYKWDGHEKEEDALLALQDAEAEFEMRQKVTEAIAWSRLGGGGAIVIGTKGQDLSEPLILDKIGKGDLDFLHVYERWYASPTGEIDYDVRSRNWLKPLQYTLGSTGMDSPLVHWSRLVRFTGARTPYNYWVQTNRWGLSVLQAPFDAIRRYEAAAAAIATLTQEANVDVFRIKNFFDKIGSEEGEAQLRARFELVQLLKSINRAVLLDFEDEYTQKQINFGSADKVLEEFRLEVCGASGTPMTVLFGQSPGGMNATGEHDEKNYNRRIKGGQETIRSPLMQLYRVLARSTLDEMPNRFQLIFNPLTQLSDTEQAKAELDRANTDDKNVNNGIITRSIANRRLKRLGTYPDMTDEDSDMIQEMEQAMHEAEEEEREQAATGGAPGGGTGGGGAVGAGTTGSAAAGGGEPGEGPGENDDKGTPGAQSGDPKANPRRGNELAADHALRARDVIRKSGGKYFVYSETGNKRLGGPYATRGEALARLRQVEHFKATRPGRDVSKNESSKVIARMSFQGLPIALEHRTGDVRRWYDKDGKETGSTVMKHPYGFIEGYVGSDDEDIDCYIGPHHDAEEAFGVHQLRAPDFKVLDEQKWFLGFKSGDEAKEAYLAHRNDGTAAYGGMTNLPMARFHAKLKRRTGTGPIRA